MAMVLSVPGNASDVAGVPGNNKYVIKVATFSSTYADAALTATQLGLESVHIVIAQSESVGYVAQYDYTNEELHLYYADYDASADGALVKASGTTAVTVRILAFGR